MSINNKINFKKSIDLYSYRVYNYKCSKELQQIYGLCIRQKCNLEGDIMINKFYDEDNTFVFVETEEKLIMWLNGKCEYTFIEMADNIPSNIDEAYWISGLDIWYPMKEI